MQLIILVVTLLAPVVVGRTAIRAAPPATPPPASATPLAKPTPKPTPKPVVKPVLEGTVKGPDAKPVEGALVSATPFPEQWSDSPRTTRTDPAGHFRLELASTTLHTVRIEARGLAAVRLEKLRPGQSVAATLGRGRTIEGTVHDESGQPVVGARVLARSEGGITYSAWEPGAGASEATTDGRGRFRLEGIAPGLHTVQATARGYGEATRRNIRAQATGVSLALRSGGWLSGRVVDPSGTAVKGALVRAEQDPRFGEASRAEATDGEGRFELTGLPAGRYTVVANARGFGLGLERGVALTSDGPSEVAVTLTVGASIKGRLVDPQQRPLKGRARIQELARQTLPAAASEILAADAQADGRFQIDRVPPGEWTLGVTAPGFAGQRVEAQVEAREPLVDVGDVVLERGLTIQGRVRIAAGAAVAGAAISGYDDDGNNVFARSEDDGTFVLAGLQPRSYELYVQATGFAPLLKQLSPGPEMADLVLSPGGAISGLVVEDGDRPVESYRVQANADRADRRNPTGASQTVGSSDGRFLLEDVAEGNYVLQVLAPDRAPGSASGIKVVAGRTTDAGTIRLGRGGIVRGTVVDLGGNAVAGATVKAVGPGDGRQRWMDLNTALTDTAGGFEIQGVPPGNATVAAGHPQYAPAETTVMVEPAKGPSEVRLTLPLGGRIEGTARRREGTPLSGLAVGIWSRGRRALVPSGSSSRVTTGSDGSFAADHVPPGMVQVSLMAEAGPAEMVSTLSRTVEVREGETSTVDFVTREILVSGHTTRSGSPLAGLRLELWGEGSSASHFGDEGGVPAAPVGPQHMRAVSGEDGSYAMVVDEPGHFEVQVTSPDGRTQYPIRFVDVPDADNYTLELDYSGALVSGQVVDKAAEQPVATALVYARPKPPRKEGGAGGNSGPDGRFVLNVEPGDYVVVVRADRYAEANVDIAVGPDGLSDLRVALEKGLEIAGRFVDMDGRGVSDLTAAAMSEDDHFSGFVRTLADGTFRFGTLADSTYAVCGGNEQAGFGVRAGLKPGAADVTLTLRPAARLRVLIRGPDGAPLAKAYPRVTRVGGARVRVPTTQVAPSDSNGITTLPVPAGNLELEVRGEKYKGSVRLTAAEGATVPVEISLTEPIDAPK